MRSPALFAAALLLPSVLAQRTYQPAAPRTLLRAGHVLDVHTGKETPAQTIVVSTVDHLVATLPTREPRVALDTY